MDNSFIIENLLQQPEGVRLEFKAQLNMEAIAKTITAFINTQGGDLVVGIDDDKKVIGIEDALAKSRVIQRALIEEIKPTAPISVQVIRYKNKELILISVWEGAKKPYQHKGIIFNRKGQASKTTSVESLSTLINDRRKADFHWERMPVLGAELKDLDNVEINRTIESYIEYKPEASFRDSEDFLIQQGLIQNGSLTNACVVLFGKNPSRFIPQSRIRLTVYPSKETGDSFHDDKTFEGNLFQNITSILNYLDNTFGKSMSVNGVLRTEKVNYPIMAVREGVLNAMVHRDYNSVNGFMQIALFTDRTEISNYGGLPDGMTVKDLKIEHSSILRNPDIAQICFIRKYIEMLGSGTLRMVKDCRKNWFKSPVWVEKNNIIKLTFPGVSYNKKSEGVNEGVNEGVKLNIEGVNEGVEKELMEVLAFLNTNPAQRVPEIAEHLGKGISTIERYIKTLKDNELIEFIGAPKTGGYQLKKQK